MLTNYFMYCNGFFILLLVYLHSTTTYAQTDDFLQPVVGRYTGSRRDDHSYAKLRASLLTGLSDQPLARAIILPPFSPEYVVSVDRDRAAQHYYLSYRLNRRSARYSPRKDAAQPAARTNYQIELTPDYAHALGALFEAALLQTHYPQPDSVVTVVADATTYVFINFRNSTGLKNGCVSRWEAGTHMAVLTGIVESLLKVAKAEASEEFRLKLLEEIQLLTQQLNSR